MDAGAQIENPVLRVHTAQADATVPIMVRLTPRSGVTIAGNRFNVVTAGYFRDQRFSRYAGRVRQYLETRLRNLGAIVVSDRRESEYELAIVPSGPLANNPYEENYGAVRSFVVINITNAPRVNPGASFLYYVSYGGFGPYADFTVVIGAAMRDFFQNFGRTDGAERWLYFKLDLRRLDAIRDLQDFDD
jgi:hypothetical protein